MTDDTLSRVPFESVIVKTRLPGQERYVLACIMNEGNHSTAAAMVRDLLLDGIEANGWDEAARIKAYAEYRLNCIRTGTVNEYEGE